MKLHPLLAIQVLALLLAGCGPGVTPAASPTTAALPSPTFTAAQPSARPSASAAPSATPSPTASPSATPLPSLALDPANPLSGQGFQALVRTDTLALWDLDTGRQILVLDQPFPADNQTWAFSPDGRRLVFVIPSSLNTVEAYYMLDLESGERIQIEGQGVDAINLAWHPSGVALGIGNALYDAGDGRLLGALGTGARSTGRVSFSADGRWYAMNGQWLQISELALDEQGAPNGKSRSDRMCALRPVGLVCVEYFYEGLTNQMLEQLSPLDQIGVVEAAWSPQDERLALLTDRGVYLVDAEGRLLDELTAGYAPLQDASAIPGTLAWSPDGRQVAFSASWRESPVGVYRSHALAARTDGGGVVEFSAGPYPDGRALAWSPDAQWLLYKDIMRGEIVAAKADGTRLRVWLFAESLMPEVKLDLIRAVSFRPVTAAATSGSSCDPAWRRLRVGDTAQVSDDSPLANRVRSAPELADNVIGVLGPGAVVKIIGGPACVPPFLFWQVENPTLPGGNGWTAEGDGESRFLEVLGGQASTTAVSPEATTTPRPSATPKPTATTAPTWTPSQPASLSPFATAYSSTPLPDGPALFFTIGSDLYVLEPGKTGARKIGSGLVEVVTMTGDPLGGQLLLNHWEQAGQVESLAWPGLSIRGLSDGPTDGGQGLALDTQAGLLFEGLYYDGVYVLDLATRRWQQLVKPAQLDPLHGQRGQLQLDPTRRQVYFRGAYNGSCLDCRKIFRVNYDGTGLTALVTANGGDALVLDLAAGKMVYTDGSGPYSIKFANLDGSDVRTLLTLDGPFSWCRSLALDPAGGKLYLSLFDPDTWRRRVIASVNLDGSGYQQLHRVNAVSEGGAAGAILFWPGGNPAP